MKKDDIFIWAFLSVFSLGIIGFVTYHIRNYIKRRHESEEEKEIREAKEMEKWKKHQQRGKMLIRIFGGILSLLGVIMVIAAGLLFLYQCYHLLVFGQWHEIPFSIILSKIGIFIGDGSQFQWKGVAKIFVCVSPQSSVIVMAVLGLIVVVVGNITRTNYGY